MTSKIQINLTRVMHFAEQHKQNQEQSENKHFHLLHKDDNMLTLYILPMYVCSNENSCHKVAPCTTIYPCKPLQRVISRTVPLRHNGPSEFVHSDGMLFVY